MLKQKNAAILIFLLKAALLFSQTIILDTSFSSREDWVTTSGSWDLTPGGMLAQTARNDLLAQVFTPADQAGRVRYKFEVSYLEGLRDKYGSFGFLFTNARPSTQYPWGDQDSYLFWFTYDEWSFREKKFYFQIYKNTGPASLSLLHPAKAYPLPPEYISYQAFTGDRETARSVRIELSLETNSGKGSLRLPDQTLLPFTLPASLPAGRFFAFCTNQVAVAFDNLTITALPGTSLPGLTENAPSPTPGGTLEQEESQVPAEKAIPETGYEPAEAAGPGEKDSPPENTSMAGTENKPDEESPEEELARTFIPDKKHSPESVPEPAGGEEEVPENDAP